jgi:pyrroloquinoline-quinone synthase
MILSYSLLNHPFYQAWSHGTVTRGQLARYARSYAEFIAEMPAYWARIGQDFGVDTSAIVAEETQHIALWEKWSAQLPKTADYPRMTEVLDAFANFNASELLGAVQAFEIQQPGVARTKKDGLLAHYGFAETDTVYFDEHLNEQAHIDFGAGLAADKANLVELQKGFNRGAEVVYRSLDLFGN